MTHKRRPQKPDVARLLARLEGEEQRFLEQEFLAPVVSGGVVRVRIGGAVCQLTVEPADFTGWGVFRPLDFRLAEFVRRAGMVERRRYLELFPRLRLIVCRRDGESWLGSAASFGDARIRLEGLAPIALAEEVQLFDCAAVRFDGMHFWFEEVDQRGDPAAAAYLRQALQQQLAPSDLARPGLTAEQRAAYELNYWERMQPDVAPEPLVEEESPEQRRRLGPGRHARRREARHAFDPVAVRLRETLSHAGAELLGYLERGDSFRVSYTVGGQNYTSSVAKEDLTVQVAGICLSGEDQKFDLASLVGVLREGENDYLLRIGDEFGAMNEEDYWRAHPPGSR